MSPEARDYLDEVVDHLERRSIKRTAVDWDALRRDVQATARDARTTAETYPAIALALERLRDGHSVLITPEQVRLLREGQAQTTGLSIVRPEGVVAKVLPHSPAALAGVQAGDVIERINGIAPAGMDRVQWRAALRAPVIELQITRASTTSRLVVTLHPAVCPIAMRPEGRWLKPGFGYLELPEMSGSADRVAEYATDAQRHIRTLDQREPGGWIVDLRRNGGGNMWPMLAGVGPLAGEGLLGAFVSPDRIEHWGYRAGQAHMGQQVMAYVDEPHVLRRPPRSPSSPAGSPRARGNWCSSHSGAARRRAASASQPQVCPPAMRT